MAEKSIFDPVEQTLMEEMFKAQRASLERMKPRFERLQLKDLYTGQLQKLEILRQKVMKL